MQAVVFYLQSEVSWVVAIISPGTVMGSMVASCVSDKFGRRVTLLASALTYVVGTVSFTG